MPPSAPPGAPQQEKAPPPPSVDILNESDLTVTDRAADVAWELALGAAFTTAQVMARTGLRRRGAEALMGRMSRRKPIVYFRKHWMSLATATVLAETGNETR